jgi:ribosomal protein L11 methyltransferase
MEMGNDWTELILTVDTEHGDTAQNIAQMATDYGIYVEDYSNLEEEASAIAHIDLFDQDLLSKRRDKMLIHLYFSPKDNPAETSVFLQERLSAEEIPFDMSWTDCAMDDWLNNWKKYFKPIPIGEKLMIRPVWEENFDSQGRTVLNLEPGLAFGTGTHETTRLCLEMIERYMKPGDSFLDVGCGSGILSVAGLLLGASCAVGVDIDPLAVKTARQNAAMNGVEQNFTAVCGSLTDHISGKFHFIAANIVADVILLLLKDIRTFMEPNAVLILSGIIDIREQDVVSALEKSFTIIDRRVENGWVALAVQAS